MVACLPWASVGPLLPFAKLTLFAVAAEGSGRAHNQRSMLQFTTSPAVPARGQEASGDEEAQTASSDFQPPSVTASASPTLSVNPCVVTGPRRPSPSSQLRSVEASAALAPAASAASQPLVRIPPARPHSVAGSPSASTVVGALSSAAWSSPALRSAVPASASSLSHLSAPSPSPLSSPPTSHPVSATLSSNPFHVPDEYFDELCDGLVPAPSPPSSMAPPPTRARSTASTSPAASSALPATTLAASPRVTANVSGPRGPGRPGASGVGKPSSVPRSCTAHLSTQLSLLVLIVSRVVLPMPTVAGLHSSCVPRQLTVFVCGSCILCPGQEQAAHHRCWTRLVQPPLLREPWVHPIVARVYRTRCAAAHR